MKPDLERKKFHQEKLHTECVAAGADKAGIFDTFGVGSVSTMKYITQKVRGMIPPKMDLMCHCHNTFGLAVANSLEAVNAGAAG
jgi:isopropylmalate/homocitrate/citramalate synthase